MALQLLTNGALLYQDGDLRSECCCAESSSSFDCDYPVLPLTINGITKDNASGLDGGGYYYSKNGIKWYDGDTNFICPDSYSINDTCTVTTVGVKQYGHHRYERWRWDGGGLPEISLVTFTGGNAIKRTGHTNCLGIFIFNNQRKFVMGGLIDYRDKWCKAQTCLPCPNFPDSLRSTYRNTYNIVSNSIPTMPGQATLLNIAGYYKGSNGLIISWGELVR